VTSLSNEKRAARVRGWLRKSEVEDARGSFDPAKAARVLPYGIGRVAGSEVVQLYPHEAVTSVTEPVEALKRFKRVWLAPGAGTQVRLRLGSKEFAIRDERLRHAVELGTFRAMVGWDSVNLKSATFKVTS
jgi:Fibronectin type III-like domain